ncbi:MAG: DUF368 domain-containing protein [Bacteroidetes bacterium]|nr:DUF368 domain-containing protein [Bacteroidota bacterium]
MREYLAYLLKGIGMGAANVIPGVSGGTIALITGIFERLINSIKSFNLKAIRFLLKFEWKAFSNYTDLKFMIIILAGIVIAIASLAKLLDHLFTNYPIYIWAYFFGLVLASVYFVGKTVKHWSIRVITTFIIGTTIAVFISILNPTTENNSFFYLFLCGVAAICSMILPGLSGSFILLLMGNYKLVAIDAINNLDFTILTPVILGAVVGIIVFSHLISWVFKRFRNETISLLTGFILGSVSVLWPWKEKILLLNEFGEAVLKNGEVVVLKFEHILPQSLNFEFWIAILFISCGILSIWFVETLAQKQ